MPMGFDPPFKEKPYRALKLCAEVPGLSTTDLVVALSIEQQGKLRVPGEPKELEGLFLQRPQIRQLVVGQAAGVRGHPATVATARAQLLQLCSKVPAIILR